MERPPQNPRGPAVPLALLALASAIGLFLFGWWRYEEPPAPAGEPTAVLPGAPDAGTAAGAELRRGLTVDPPEPTTATVDVRLQCAGAARLQRIVFRVIDDRGQVVANAERRGLHEVFTADLAVPVQTWLTVGAEVFAPVDAADGVAVFPARVRLQPGERRKVELSCGEGPTTLRIGGPSPELLPRLTLELQPLAVRGGRARAPFEVHPSAGGTVRCFLPEEPFRASFRLAGGGETVLQTAGGALDFVPRAGDVRLEPTEPLVGIVVGSLGDEVPAALSFDGAASEAETAPCHATTAARLAEATELHGWTAECGPFTFAASALQARADLRLLDIRLATRLATLVVHIAAPTEPASPLDLTAEPRSGGAPIRLERVEAKRRAVLPAGDYRLFWDVRGGRGPVAADAVPLVAGQTSELHLQPLPLQRWTVQLRDADPERSVVLFLKLAAVHSLGGARDGAFAMDLHRAPQVGEPAEVFSWVLKCTFPATVVGVDGWAHRAEITSPVTTATWCRVRAQPMANGTTSLRLQPVDGVDSRLPAFLGGDVMVPLLPGATRSGCMLETIEGRQQLVAWFRIESGTQDRIVQGSGRWTVLRLLRPVVSAQVSAAGPDGVGPMAVFTMHGAGDHPLFVADGTRLFHIDLEPGGRTTFDAASPIVVR